MKTLNIKESMAGYIINDKYEIYESEQGSWRIWDLKKRDFVTFGGTTLYLDSKQEATDFLKDETLIQ